MAPRRRLAGVAAVTVAGATAVGAGVVVVDATRASPSPAPAASNASAPTTATVERRDLVRNDEYGGTFGFGAAEALELPLSGVLTGLPAPGDELTEGQPIVSVDGRPVIALYGELPMWRDLGPGVSAGGDVWTFEGKLAELGYAERFGVEVDDTWTAATTRALKAFQADHGQVADGTVTRGEIVYLPGPRRVAGITGVLGGASDAAGITTTTDEAAVSVSVKSAAAAAMRVGQSVQVKVADTTVDATIAAIGVPVTDDQGASKTTVTVSLGKPIDAPSGSAATLLVADVEAEQVLAVPAEALLALAEGGYAVEVVAGTGASKLAGVTIGAFADGFVEIDGDVDAGDQVVMP